MALIKCPECSNDVSDKTEKCPKCGYEFKKKVGSGSLELDKFILNMLL
jgi:predicted amidophosphoribosyltransferase